MCADAGGISQTLYNVFSFNDVNSILCITSSTAYKLHRPTKPFDQVYITYDFDIISLPGNRFSKYIVPLISWFNYSFNNYFRKFAKIRAKIIQFNPDVVISCSNTSMGIFMHNKLVDGLDFKKIFPYFMDDWMTQSGLKWFGGDTDKYVKKILSQNKSWLVVSEGLAQILSEKYGVRPNRILVVHNPIDISELNTLHPINISKSAYTIAYAGALWDMHYDAFYTVAKSIFLLNRKIKLTIILYTSLKFWNWRKSELEPMGVIYGGNIPYSEIHNKLSQSDFLLLVSSFSPRWINHSRGSLQTKLTDYLKSKRLIISCGPSYSANHHFLKKNDCGICIETDDPIMVAEELDTIVGKIAYNQKFVDNGQKCIMKLSKPNVHSKLVEFLNN